VRASVAARRQQRSAPLVADLDVWMREQCARLSPRHDVAKTMNHMLKRWDSFVRFLDDGRTACPPRAFRRTSSAMRDG
jgi:transposase